MDKPYVHDALVHNLQAPREIVPILIEKKKKKSVVDVGCGLGTFLRVFMENGITDVSGLDGSWVDKNLLSENLPLECFREVNLEDFIQADRKFDMALCLEVAEHLPKCKANNIVSTLINLSDIIIFSAAIPNQGGQNHVNEQWPTYWEELFNAHNYLMYDVIRPKIWDNSNIFFWYKQNIFVYVRKGHKRNSLTDNPSSMIRNVVHPDLFNLQCNALVDAQKKLIYVDGQLEKLVSGDSPLKLYLNVITRYVIKKIHKILHCTRSN